MKYTNLDDHIGLELMADLVTCNTKHIFTEEELKQQASIGAQAVSDKTSVENDKKVAMAAFKNRIDTLDAEIKLRAMHINNGYTYLDKAATMYRDYANMRRVFFDKSTGDYLRDETFHESDFQKKLDFEANEKAKQEQIDENNTAGNFADGLDALDEVIVNKKLGRDKHGNLTDIDPVSFDDIS